MTEEGLIVYFSSAMLNSVFFCFVIVCCYTRISKINCSKRDTFAKITLPIGATLTYSLMV